MLESYCVNELYTIKETIERFETKNDRVAIVVNKENKVVGVVSQGDILRALSSGVSIYTYINQIISNSFLHLYERNLTEAYKIFKNRKITLLPVVNKKNELIDAIVLDDIYQYLEDKSLMSK